jgi:hypothetical protein
MSDQASRSLATSVVPKHQRHKRIAGVLALELVPAVRVSRHGVMWYSIDHGASAVLAPNERRALGFVSGQPDIIIVCLGRACMLWIKAEGGMLSDAQQSFITAVSMAGARVGVVRDTAEAIACLDEWQIPRARRVRGADMIRSAI